MNDAQRRELDRLARRRTTTTVDPGAMFTLTADGELFTSPELFAEEAPASEPELRVILTTRTDGEPIRRSRPGAHFAAFCAAVLPNGRRFCMAPAVEPGRPCSAHLDQVTEPELRPSLF